MSDLKRSMWQFPWRYKESITFVLGFLVIGIFLQLLFGNFDFFLLHSPVNFIIGGVLIVLVIALSFIKGNSLIDWLCGVPLSVTVIGALLLLGIVMGLTPQFSRVSTDPHIHLEHSTWGQIFDYAIFRLGFKQMTTSWPFVVIYTLNLFVLGLVVTKRMQSFKWRDYAFYLNHLGLWLFLFAAGLGSADMLRYVMYVERDEVEWRVYDKNDNVLELDIAIQLNNFVMEEYPPKLAIINKYTGDVLPHGKPEYYQLEDRPEGTLVDWKIEPQQYIHQAVRKTDTTFQEVPMPGSMPAVEVKAVNIKTGQEVSGWVTCGSVDQFVMPLDLDDSLSIVMTTPEPKKFLSDVTIMSKDNDTEAIHTTLEVNKPYRLGNWTIYQYDYDHELGKASRYSGFELVYDPWLYAVYAGMILMALGAICMLWLGNKKRK